MTEKSKGIWIFWTSLCVTMVVLGALLLGLLMLMKTSQPTDRAQENVPYFREDDKPGKRENLQAILFGCREAESLPELVEVLFYDAPNSELTILLLPPETVCTLNGRTDTLQGHYDYEGMSGGVKAVKALLGADIDRYLRIQKKGIANLCDYLGGIEYEVAEDDVIDGQHILAGRQLLDGRRFASFLFRTDEFEKVDVASQAEFTDKLLASGLKQQATEDYAGLVSAVFYNCETNLNQYDFAIRQQSFTAYLSLDKLSLHVRFLEGNFNADHTEFSPAAESLDEISKLFSQ